MNPIQQSGEDLERTASQALRARDRGHEVALMQPAVSTTRTCATNRVPNGGGQGLDTRMRGGSRAVPTTVPPTTDSLTA